MLHGVTYGYTGLHEATQGIYTGLNGATRATQSYIRLHRVTWGTQSYIRLHRVTWGYIYTQG